LKPELCHCLGADPNCANCNGTGTVEKLAESMRGSPWIVNTFVPEGIPYSECIPSQKCVTRDIGARVLG